MGAHGSKEKLTRSASERYVQHKLIEQERERFGRFGKRARGNCIIVLYASSVWSGISIAKKNAMPNMYAKCL